jgi:hypothetical protein
LHIALKRPHVETVPLLIKRRHPLEMQNYLGQTPWALCRYQAVNCDRDERDAYAQIDGMFLEAGAQEPPPPPSSKCTIM